jgi:hypothetical protein
MNTHHPQTQWIGKHLLGQSQGEHWSCFASDIPLDVGVWPDRVFVQPPIGNGETFHQVEIHYDEEELHWVRYKQPNSTTQLTIFND